VATTRIANRRAFVALTLAVAAVVGCATADAPPAPADVRAALAPTGTLRIAVYSGSPTSLVRRALTAHGLSVDLGREMARRLGVPAGLIEFERVEQVVAALHAGQADMTITNATPARAALIDFTEPLVQLELGILVPAGSLIASIDEVDRPGVRVGVSQGSSSQAALGRAYRNATLVPAPSLQAASAMLAEGRVDAFATNKGILYQLGDGLPGARVLDGRWGTESLAIGVPQGRQAAQPWLAQLVASLRDGGDVQRAAERAGLRGVASR